MRRSLKALTHLWSDGFSRDSGLKRARGEGGRGRKACSVSAIGQEGRRTDRKSTSCGGGAASPKAQVVFHKLQVSTGRAGGR